MAFQVSPGVNVSEIDLSNVIPAVSVSTGAIAGVFRWGPVNELTLISSEKQLATVFGEPASYFTDNTYTTSWSNYETFFSAANFLSYSNSLYVVRTVGDTAATGATSAINTTGGFSAKYPGALGNSLSVSVCSTESETDENGDPRVPETGFDKVENDFVITVNPFGYTATDNSTQNRSAGEIVQTGTVSGLLTNTLPTDFPSVGDAVELTNGERLIVSAVATAVEEYAAGNAFAFYTGAESEVIGTVTSTATDISFAGSTITTAQTNVPAIDFIPGDATDFAVGDVIRVDAATDNTNGGFYRIAEVTATKIRVEGTNVFTTQDAATAGSTTISKRGSVKSSDNTLLIPAHGLVTGQAVTYTGANESIGITLTEGDPLATAPLYVIRETEDTFQVALTAEDAFAGTAIDLTAVSGDGVEQTITPRQSFSVQLTFDSVYTQSTAYTSGAFTSQWRDADLFLSAPSTSRVHVVVRDEKGDITGTKDTILEIYENVSIDPSATLTDGSTNYIVDILENSSRWIELTTAQAAALVTTKVSTELSVTGGADGEDESAIAIGDVTDGYDLFKDPANVDISLVIQGKARNTVLGNYIVNNIAEARKDCVEAHILLSIADTSINTTSITTYIVGFHSTVISLVSVLEQTTSVIHGSLQQDSIVVSSRTLLS